ncbi:MAG: DsbA family protein [Catenulispora sp.]|nr:DsbA family protein [Catenulispora sp.]
MSQANRVGKQNARERVAAEKLKRQRAERRRKQITIGTAVVGVLALAGGIGIAVQAAKHSKPYLAPVAAVVDSQAKSTKDLGIQIGSADAPVTMNVFEDFRCPVCQAVEQATEPTYKQYVEDGKLKVIYHPARVLDSHDNGTGSLNGANAAACAQDQGQFLPVHDLLYANQPNENQDLYSSKTKILSITGEIPALKASTAFTDCVNKGDHDGWVQKNADNFSKIGLTGTPSIFVDGQQLNFPQSPADMVTYLKQQLDAAFTKAGKPAGTKVTLPANPAESSASGAPSASGSSSSSGSPAPSAASSSSSAPPASGSSSSSAGATTPSSSKS